MIVRIFCHEMQTELIKQYGGGSVFKRLDRDARLRLKRHDCRKQDLDRARQKRLKLVYKFKFKDLHHHTNSNCSGIFIFLKLNLDHNIFYSVNEFVGWILQVNFKLMAILWMLS